MIETTITLDSVVVATILAIIAGLVRNVSGWAENALKDGVIESYEWRQLAGTLAMYIGTINVMSIGLDPTMATTVAIILDMVKGSLKGI